MNKPRLTANILFSGIGCQERGIENSNLFDFSVNATSDIDKDAILTYAAIHCGLTNEMIDTYSEYLTREEMAQQLTDINLGYDPQKDKKYDWFKLAKRKSNDINKYWLANKLAKNKGDISKIEFLSYADLWTISFCCFAADTLVLSNRGYQPISKLKVGDKVLTKDNTYQTVEKVACTGKKEIYEINAMSCDKIRTTDNHRFLTRKRNHIWNNDKRMYDRVFELPTWTECKDLTKDTYLGYAINNNDIVPQWDGIISKKGKTINKLNTLMNNKDFWWLIGRYVADGWCRQQGGITICCGKKEKGEIESYLETCGFNYSIFYDNTVIRYDIPLIELESFVKQFGYMAHGKYIPSFVFDLPIMLLNSFLDGYMSGDGCCINGLYKATSVSRELVYGIGQIVAKIYHRPFSIYFEKRPSKTIIDGREVNQRDTYTITFKTNIDKQDKAFYDNGFIWFPINQVTNTHLTEDVYDITVANNHSFTANGAIVHNCQDISVAGKMKGLKPDSGTRSSLLWENIRLLKRAKDDGTLPKFLMFENVKNLVSKKFIGDFNNLLEVLDELGFNSYWQVLNGKECGIPQNRERVFVICIRKDIDNNKFNFPKPFDNGMRLKDLLEETVDEKYYLSKQVQERFQFTDDTFTKNIVGTTKPEFRTIGQKDLVYQENSIMGALTATDYKQPKQIVETNRCIQSGNLTGGKWDKIYESARRYYSTEGVSPTLHTCGGGNTETKIIEDQTYVDNISDKYSFAKRKAQKMLDDNGKLPEMFNPYNNYEVTDYAPTQTACCDRSASIATVLRKEGNGYIRKLTPRECWKLMGLTFEDCDKASAVGVADCNLYKQAGNGIVTNCVELLAEHLYKTLYDNTYICTDENFIKPQVD